MFVVEADQGGRRRWVSGVFRERADADQFFAAIPPTLRRWQRLSEVPFAEYPLYLIEQRGFRFVSLDELKQLLGDLQNDEPSGESHLTAYRVDQDFAPLRPGEDAMGGLAHVHVDDRFLRRYFAAGQNADPFSI